MAANDPQQSPVIAHQYHNAQQNGLSAKDQAKANQLFPGGEKPLHGPLTEEEKQRDKNDQSERGEESDETQAVSQQGMSLLQEAFQTLGQLRELGYFHSEMFNIMVRILHKLAENQSALEVLSSTCSSAQFNFLRRVAGGLTSDYSTSSEERHNFGAKVEDSRNAPEPPPMPAHHP